MTETILRGDIVLYRHTQWDVAAVRPAQDGTSHQVRVTREISFFNDKGKRIKKSVGKWVQASDCELLGRQTTLFGDVS